MTIDIENDIFARPPRRIARTEARATRITCRVCDLPATVDINTAGLLCGLCRADLVQTRLHVETVLSMCETRWREAYEAFEDQANREPRWAAVCAARHTAAPELFSEAWRRRKAEGGTLAALLIASEALDALSEELTMRRVWAACALEEINAAEQ